MHRHDSVGEKINSDADTRSPPPVQIALPRLEFSDQTGKPDVRRSRKDVRRSVGPDANRSQSPSHGRKTDWNQRKKHAVSLMLWRVVNKTYIYGMYSVRTQTNQSAQGPLLALESSWPCSASSSPPTPLHSTPSHGHHKKILYCVRTCFHDQSSITSCVSSICNEMKHKHKPSFSASHITGSQT